MSLVPSSERTTERLVTSAWVALILMMRRPGGALR